MPACRLLPTAARSGPANMAADEALMRSALDQGVASLRFYTWTEPTLSLGYFQPHAERLSDALLEDAAWVRRPTGGAAILHHLELTYSLALPAGPPWHSTESWLCRFHQAVAAALGQFGVESWLMAQGAEKTLGPFLCFLHQTPGDVLVNGHKVVGSAQRRPRGAIMQHGSILLRQSALTPALPGIAELSGACPTVPELEQAIVTELARITEWEFEPAYWTAAERRTMAELVRTKYATAEWNEKR
jgi:lipoyl(octanoyl) transferase